MRLKLKFPYLLIELNKIDHHSPLRFQASLRLESHCMARLGQEENTLRYGGAKPPKYSFEAVEGVKVILVGGKEDELVSIKDVGGLKGVLGKQNVLFGYH